jgi:hypothetical protein
MSLTRLIVCIHHSSERLLKPELWSFPRIQIWQQKQNKIASSLNPTQKPELPFSSFLFHGQDHCMHTSFIREPLETGAMELPKDSDLAAEEKTSREGL